MKVILFFLPLLLFALDVKKEIVKYYKNYYPNIKIEKITLSKPIKTAKKIEFLFSPKSPYGNIKINNQYIYVKIKAKLPVFIATKIIKQNSLILKNINVKKRLINFRFFYSKPISKIQNNLIASTIIAKNSILTKANTKIKPAILKNEKVLVIIKSNAISINTQAIALQDGNIGENIKIQLNRKIFNAKVIKKGVVEIE